ncbi:MAG: alpha-2-macroglobulin family protein [bacterium]
MSRLRVFAPLVLAGLVATIVLGCNSPPPVSEKVDGYVALVPRVLRSGETASFSFSLFNGEKLAKSQVSVSVLDKGKPIASATASIDGKGTVALDLPRVSAGEYQVAFTGAGFSDTTPVQIQSGTLLFLETDKPIYKPGQTILMRVVALDSELKPVSTQATIEVQDAKGIKVFKQTVATDEFGTVTTKLPLSTEPNLGVWKLTASAGDSSTDLDVRVEKYVLPKYEVKVDLAKQWFLVDEPITGHVAAQYSFGLPVKGELKVTASRYVGTWEEFATFTAAIDAEGDFRIQPAGYVAGVPEAGGLGNVRLDVVVVERATGYEEKTTELVTVAASPLNIKLIPESSAFKPTLPFSVLLVTETPGGEPVESAVTVETTYLDEEFGEVGHERQQVGTSRGTAMVRLTPPQKAVRVMISATSGDAGAFKELTAAYSPSGNFIHVQQLGSPALAVGDTATFRVASTAEARTFYYEVVSRGRVVFTGSASDDIYFRVTPAMAPSARLLVYQILPSSEVAADALPFEVQGEYPQKVSASFGTEEAKPGDEITVQVQTEGPAKVGLVAVDHSVFILAENRLNLEQVFAELERLYMQPQVELHEGEWMGGPLLIPGAKETFQDAGLIVLSNKRVPEGKEIPQPQMMFEGVRDAKGAPGVFMASPTTTAAAGAAQPPAYQGGSGELAEVQRVRQFFPETWIWDETITDDAGRASLSYEAPDSITTWDLRAVALSADKGLGIAETSLRVFQPFFLQADLPYSAIRGEEFPVKIALYNYLETSQQIQVEIEPAPWFELVDYPRTTVTVAGGDIGSAEFRIRPKTIGTQLVKITARSAEAADAVTKSMIVEPEGVSRETVENTVLPAGASRTLSLALPALGVVPDSARAYVAITGSLLAQTIEGLDQLLQMPFGCGEQNMILFAPDTYILDYLKGTRQLKPEIQAKAEGLLVTGYQRELTYRRSDGSFSAFGEQDEEGSLFLTAFVLKTFAQAKDLTFIDESVLAEAAGWITQHQKADGSFEAVGFVHHQDMMGGVQGKDALTAYVTIALLEAGQTAAADKAIAYLEDRLAAIEDPYGLALTTYALQLGGSGRAAQAQQKLMAAATEDENGVHWSGGSVEPMGGAPGGPQPIAPGPEGDPLRLGIIPSLDIEATGYATLALVEGGDRVNASRAAKWLVGQRNSQGGFGSTQDTVVALQALTQYSTLGATDTDLTVKLSAGDVAKEIRISPDNFDVTQVVEVPAGIQVRLEAQGKGEAVIQGVLRYNLPEAEKVASVFDIKVDYSTAQVEVNDLIDVKVAVAFNPPEPIKAGMVVLDVSVPTGFAAVDESLSRLLEQPKIKRYDLAGRKVIVYLEDLSPGEKVSFSFQARALYPVRAKGAVSVAYSYYTPEWRGETVSQALSVQ